MHSMPSDIVVHKLLVEPCELRHDRMATFDLETQSLTSIKDHSSRPQADLEPQDFALG